MGEVYSLVRLILLCYLLSMIYLVKGLLTKNALDMGSWFISALCLESCCLIEIKRNVSYYTGSGNYDIDEACKESCNCWCA